MPILKINDISMYYESHGQGEPLVFIGGFSVDHTTWYPIIDKFKDNYQVILFDNRGAGQSTIPQGPYSIEQMSQDVADLCSKLNINKAHFIGNSMGGHILQMLALKHAHLVKSAIISNSSMTAESCFELFLEAQLELLKANAPLTALIKATFSWIFSYSFISQPGMKEQLIKLTLENPHPFTVIAYEGQYAALKKFNSSAWIKQITVPTLVLAGDQDLIFSEASVKLLADRIPHAKYHCFKECGHLPYVEHSEEFAQIVKKFIA